MLRKIPAKCKKCFAKAMEKFLNDQQRRPPRSGPTGHPNPKSNVFGVGIPYTDMESADSHDSRSNTFDPDNLDIDGFRRPQFVYDKSHYGRGFCCTAIRMSAIADLKEFSGRDHDDNRARSWMQKVRSDLLREQAPNSEKCLVFGDLLTGPA